MPTADTPILTDALLATLAFYSENGVDVAVDEAPFNAFVAVETAPVGRPAAEPPRRAERSAPPVQTSRPAAASPVPSQGAQVVAEAARTLATACSDLDALHEALTHFDGCALKATASSLVFEDGARDADVMFVGEAPGREEDLAGKPFVGASGHLLNKALAALGWRREDVYVANIIPWRPPGNRTPTPQEIAACLPFIERQIALKRPKLLVCLGGPAAQTLMHLRQGILKERGRLGQCPVGETSVPALATLHPAYVLRSPAAKRLLWADLLAAKRFISQGH